jgi:hypothetical protein
VPVAVSGQDSFSRAPLRTAKEARFMQSSRTEIPAGVSRSDGVHTLPHHVASIAGKWLPQPGSAPGEWRHALMWTTESGLRVSPRPYRPGPVSPPLPRTSPMVRACREEEQALVFTPRSSASS